jgi:glycosyltransferase involved in cell wall biosynthesis
VKIALIGTRGVPAHYGGFETAAEEIGARLAGTGHEIVVYSREQGPNRYRDMQVVHLPTIRTKYTDTLVHSTLAIAHACAARPDVAVIFNAANAPLARPLHGLRIPYAVHVDGLEWKRAKWNGVGRAYYLFAERIAVRTANALIVDSRGIEAYYADRYGAPTVYIAYGAPIRHVNDRVVEDLEALGLDLGRFHLVVARFEPENQVREILQGYTASSATFPLVVVGTAPYSDRYRQELCAIAGADSRIRMIGPIWDSDLLDATYAGCASYVHGHSVGGTNPSLLRAAGAGACCIAFDVSFNREVLREHALYFADADELRAKIEQVEVMPDHRRALSTAVRAHVEKAYDWDEIALTYEQLCEHLVTNARTR